MHMFRISVLTLITTLALAGVVTSCGKKEKTVSVESQSEMPADTVPEIPVYHADNDIAMTLRSLVDALREDEPLDSASYNFEGVLTDGQGYPLYTDVQGGPGVWKVEVLGEHTAAIRNLYLGDLFPDDLRTYIISSLGIDPDSGANDESLDHDDHNSAIVYPIEGGEMRVETHSALTSNGREGIIMRIIIRDTPATLQKN